MPKTFKDCELGVFEVQPDKTAATAAGFMERLRAKTPFVIRTALTGNGEEGSPEIQMILCGA